MLFINSIHNLSSSHSISATFHSSKSSVIHFTITFPPRTEDDNRHPKAAKAGRGKTNCTSPGGRKPQTEHCAAQHSTVQIYVACPRAAWLSEPQSWSWSGSGFVIQLSASLQSVKEPPKSHNEVQNVINLPAQRCSCNCNSNSKLQQQTATDNKRKSPVLAELAAGKV